MKKYLLSSLLLTFSAIGMLSYAQGGGACAVSTPVVTGLTSSPAGNGLCNYTFNVTFGQRTNGGNKRTGIYLYSGASLPNSLYGSNGQKVPDANDLNAVPNLLGTIQINNDVVSTTTSTFYNGGNLMQNPTTFKSGLTYFSIPTAVPDSNVITIQGITVQAACGGLNLQVDVGSSNAASFNQFSCLVRNLAVTGTIPNVLNALLGCSAPQFFQFTVNTSGATTITFSAYADAAMTIPLTAPAGFVYNGNGTAGPLSISTYQNVALAATGGTSTYGQFTFTNTLASGAPIYLVVQSTNSVPLVTVVDNPCAQGPLPVTFSSFTALRNRDVVNLKWETSTENNNRVFEVQRLIGNGSWETIGSVASKAQGGNSSTVLGYDFTDMKAVKVNSQYRIRQVDFDGSAEFSAIRYVKADGLASDMLIFPNPVRDGKLSIVFNNPEGLYTVQLVDGQGRMVREWANTRTNITMNGLRSGQYLVMVTDRNSNEVITHKIIVQ